MKTIIEEIFLNGSLIKKKVYRFENLEIIITGSFLKIARLREEWDQDVIDPVGLVSQFKSTGMGADILTFIQRLPESKPKYAYLMEWDNAAALPITDFDFWFKNVLHQNPRNKIRVAEKKGVVTKIFEFNDETLKDIMSIYHENPMRQGVPFSDYNISWETAKKASLTFLDRATFIGAFFEGELIGFIKLVNAGRFIRTMGILAKIAQRDKAPMNLLLAKAVEVCAKFKAPYLVYGKYNYGKVGSSTLQSFKRYFGFESIALPRYYVPLTAWGSLCLKLNLHRGLVGFLPRQLVRALLDLRGQYYAWRFSK